MKTAGNYYRVSLRAFVFLFAIPRTTYSHAATPGETGGGQSSDDRSALVTLLNGANGSHLILPQGLYTVDNSTANGGAIIMTGWSGTIVAAQGAVIQCTSLASPCLEFMNSSNVHIDGLFMRNTIAMSTCNTETTNCGSSSPISYPGATLRTLSRSNALKSASRWDMLTPPLKIQLSRLKNFRTLT